MRPQIIVISGVPGAGKSTVARGLAQRMQRAAHVEADLLQELIVAGAAVPDVSGIGDAAAHQLRLRLHNAAILARSFMEAGFSAIIDDIVTGRRFDELAHDLKGAPFGFVMLVPDFEVMKSRWRALGSPFAESWDWIDEEIREHTPRVGLWIDTTALTAEETVSEISDRLQEAEVSWPLGGAPSRRTRRHRGSAEPS